MRLQPEAPEAGWIIDWLQRNGFDALLGIGPFGIMWWQWIVLLAALAFAWLGGRILGRLTRAALHRVSTHTTTSWDDRLFASLGPPIRLAWLLIVFALIAHSIGLSGAAENVIRRPARASRSPRSSGRSGARSPSFAALTLPGRGRGPIPPRSAC